MVCNLNKQKVRKRLSILLCVVIFPCVCLHCQHTDSFVSSCVSPAAGRMWHTGGGGLALSDPGKLCHPIIISSLSVSSKPAHHSGDDHYGDWLPGVCGSRQRKPPFAADGKLFARMTVCAVDFKHKAVFLSVIMTFSKSILLNLTWWVLLLPLHGGLSIDISTSSHWLVWHAGFYTGFHIMKSISSHCCDWKLVFGCIVFGNYIVHKKIFLYLKFLWIRVAHLWVISKALNTKLLNFVGALYNVFWAVRSVKTCIVVSIWISV